MIKPGNNESGTQYTLVWAMRVHKRLCCHGLDVAQHQINNIVTQTRDMLKLACADIHKE
jgi:hypothetical protein